MTLKHTPGPWFVEDRGVYALEERDGSLQNRFWILVQGAHTPSEELQGNARLIAEAPAMLEALKGAQEAFFWHKQASRFEPTGSGGESIIEILDRVLARATGRQE